jgi:hypothetical protein
VILKTIKRANERTGGSLSIKEISPDQLKLFKNPEMAIITKLKNCPTPVSIFIPSYKCRCCFTLTDRLMQENCKVRNDAAPGLSAIYKKSSENLLLVRFTFLTKNVHIAYHNSQGQLTVFC